MSVQQWQPIVGLREPIIGLREPICGQRESIVLELRTPIHMNDPLDFNGLLTQFDNYIKFAAKQVATSHQSIVVSAEDLYQEGLLLLWKCYEQYQYKSELEFTHIFKASVWRMMRGHGRKFEPVTTDIDEAYDLGYSDTTLDDIYDEYRMKQVLDLLRDNPTAIVILQELLSPSQDTFEQCAWDMARKETVREQGCRVNVPSTLEVRGVHVQRALDLSKELYIANLRLIQSAVYKVYSPDIDIKNYIPKADELSEWFGSPVDPEQQVHVQEAAMEDGEVITLIRSLAELMSDALYTEQTKDTETA